MIKEKEVVVFAFKHPDTGEVNDKQVEFYNKVMEAVQGLNKIRQFFFGGAIRGGKTFVCLFIFYCLAKLFPKSRWHVFRSDFPELEDTTIPSMEKLIGREDCEEFRWKRKSSNYHIEFANGSKIFFKSENLMQDPELKWMLGLETNGILLEQMEGLSEKLYSRAIERVGSWYLPSMPIPLILGTFNPTDTWVKDKIYDPWVLGKLPASMDFTEALPKDNPYVTPEQWANWENLDPVSRAQLIEGIWQFLQDVKLFAYSFKKEKHVVDVQTEEGAAFMTPVKALPIYAVFDFNVDPITCLICQRYKTDWFKCLAEYRLRNSDIFALTEKVMKDWGDYYLIATGDASGRARTAITRGNRSYVKIIKAELKLSDRQMQFPRSNPSVRNTRILMNSLFHKHGNIWISSACPFLIDDLRTVKVNEKGEIDKHKDARKTHLLDDLRYIFWNYFRVFIGGKV
jgi:hypothetical protein